MSAVIGICGSNFCTLLGDTRALENGENMDWVLSSDKFHKVFQLETRTVIGMTGLLWEDEHPLSFMEGVKSIKDLTPKKARKYCCDFLAAHRGHFPSFRNYIIGGKEEDGHFVMHEIHYDDATGVVSEVPRNPTGGVNNYGLSLSLPAGVTEFMDIYVEWMRESISTAKRLDDIVSMAKKIICDVAGMDNSVNKKIDQVLIV